MASYPIAAIAPAVRDACAARGLPYQEFPNLAAAFASHFRYLRKLGQSPVAEVGSRPALTLDLAA